MNEIMLDLETMGTGPDAAILAIGAVELNRETGQLGREFYEVVDLASAMAAGGTVDASTIIWWMKQSNEARGEFERKGRTLAYVLYLFSGWVRQKFGDSFHIWGNGSDFDNVILRSAYSRLSLQVPWSHRQNRCFRTVRNEYPPVDTSTWESVKHNALSDAKWQARYLCEIPRAGHRKCAFCDLPSEVITAKGLCPTCEHAFSSTWEESMLECNCDLCTEIRAAQSRKPLRCASCGQPAVPDDGLCAECSEKLDKLACSFEGREG